MLSEEISYFPVWIGKIRKGIQKRQNKLLHPYGLSSIHSLYLAALWHVKEGMTLRELCDKLCVDKANTSRAISSMEKLGYVERISTDVGTLKYRICLTNSGRKVAKEVADSTREAHDILLNTLTKEELATIRKVMEKISVSANLI